MLSEIEQQVTAIKIACRRPVNEVLAGEYRSVFKGKGLDFDEVREYQTGDDVRLIDWNVTARTGRPHIKRYIEERELAVYLIVDYSGSSDYTSVEKTKRRAAAELCGLLAFSALKNNDKIGLIIFTDRVELFVPPAKTQSHVMRIIDELLSFEPKHCGTSVDEALQFFGQVARRTAVAFLISDFIDSGFRESMLIAAQRHDLIAISLSDRRELEMPNAGLVRLRSLEDERLQILDTASGPGRSAFNEAIRRRREMFMEIMHESQIDHVELLTNEGYVQKLVGFFRARARRQADETGG